jgi:hypothetical protein
MTDYYVTTCRYCSETIELRQISENRYLPYEYNGIKHRCKRECQK